MTDNAANNINAFQHMIIPGFEQYFVFDDASDEALSDEYEYPSDLSSTMSSSSSVDGTSEDLVQESFNRLLQNNEVFRIPCFAHTLQLIVQDGLKEAKSIVCALEKVSAIAKLAHTSSKFSEKLELMKVSISRAVVTRWNFQLVTVERILSISPMELNDVLVQLKYKHLCLNTRDLTMLQEFVSLFSLFAEATTVTQRQNSPSISFVAPSILAIYFDLMNERQNIRYTTTLCDSLLCSLLSRFGGLLEQMDINITELNIDFQINRKFYDLYKDPVFLFTPFLDRMFKLRWITESLLQNSTKERLCERIQKLIFDHCVVIEQGVESPLADTNLAVPHQEASSSSSSTSTTSRRKCLFGNIENDSKRVKKSRSIDPFGYVKEEISRYINDNNNDNMLLINPTSSSSYKTLAKLTVKYMCIPATSATVERVFSQSGFLFRPHRAPMSRKTLKHLTLLKCNHDIT